MLGGGIKHHEQSCNLKEKQKDKRRCTHNQCTCITQKQLDPPKSPMEKGKQLDASKSPMEKCRICGDWFKILGGGIKHHELSCIKCIPSRQKYVCEICMKWSSEIESELGAHKQTCVLRTEKCKNCGRWFNKVYNGISHHQCPYVTHKQLDSSKSPMEKCRICGDWFKILSGGIKHHERYCDLKEKQKDKRRCTNHVKHQDDKCTETNSFEDNLQQQHQAYVYRPRKKLIKCHLCNQQFLNQTHLQQHVLLAHENKMIAKCPYCNWEYVGDRNSIQIAFLEHKSSCIHQKYRPTQFSCKVCLAGFGYKKALTRHFRSHRIGKLKRNTPFTGNQTMRVHQKEKKDNIHQTNESDVEKAYYTGNKGHCTNSISRC